MYLMQTEEEDLGLDSTIIGTDQLKHEFRNLVPEFENCELVYRGTFDGFDKQRIQDVSTVDQCKTPEAASAALIVIKSVDEKIFGAYISGETDERD